MGGGDLNMKKSWHPLLLVNQEKVWKAEKEANEENKKLTELRKEREEERQLAELQRMQEEATGRKRVEKLDWMYAAPNSGDGGALGGQRVGEREMEEYLLGKKRVDQVLGQGDKNVGATSKEYIAVQNANTARDTANKIREDPLLMIKQRELAALQAMRNDPAVRIRMKAQSLVESKEDRRARKSREKEERKKVKHEVKEERRERREHRSHRSENDHHRERSRSPLRRSHRDHDRSRSRSRSPRRRDEDRVRVKEEVDSDRKPPPRDYGRDSRDEGRANGYGHGHGHGSNGYSHGNGHGNGYSNGHSRPVAPPPAATHPNDAARAARLAAMFSAATTLDTDRERQLSERREKERLQFALEERERNKFGAADTKGAYVREQERMMFGGGGGLGDTMTRRGGKGMLKEI